MYCTHCGRTVENYANYCSQCGTAAENCSEPRPRLSRPQQGKKVAGVCAGVARYLELEVTLVRVAWILLTIFPPVPGVLLYIACWIAMPVDPEAPRREPVAPAAGFEPKESVG